MEGALAAQPAPTPDPREPMPPIREIPGLRKRERTWKDEVRDRVRDRRERRGSDLPLFPAEGEAEPEPEVAGEDASLVEAVEPVPPPSAMEPDTLLGEEPEPDADELPGPRELGDPELDEPDLGALLLRSEPVAAAEPPRMTDVPPVERPALPVERLVAGLIDLAVLGSVWIAVVYFASRVARVPLSGLWPAWPWLLVYLGALGLLYAGYFTGTTGQTLGKMAQRLHVLHLSGGPPGHARAVARALLGSLGVVLAAGGLVPILFDPARRALHDRLLRTRVVRL